ncbi:hypothetical protein [Bradyrhizobium sp. RD5-C2]|uniref:hypothetical protein n=1 Tax=Bradyrhizobium sp. RD5-C2 TaxID=244562 RepID=UPI001CC447D1|nr:hypothetical protein [Bradyrhizobium sp. RD5-C2]GIQ73185.1 hypothetical protein BraRD5C2_16230 [Bradyrhizobium sp. RD5-C2]
MPLPSWPIASYMPDPDSFRPLQRMLDPLATDMEGGNTRQRPRPGDNVGTVTQTIWMPMAEHDVFVAWVKGTLGNGTGRFTANIWLGSSYVTKVCQFIKPGSQLLYGYLSPDKVAVTMTLRVYDV